MVFNWYYGWLYCIDKLPCVVDRSSLFYTVLYGLPLGHKEDMRMIRKQFINKYCSGKKVLDLGCKGSWQELSTLHTHLANISDVTGVDIEHCNALNFILDDVTTLKKVKGKYDVVVAGELIEHIDNLGEFLSVIKQKKYDDGLIILTTPNILSLRAIKATIFSGREAQEKGHVVAFTKTLLENICKQHGYVILESCHVYKNVQKGIFASIERVICKIFPQCKPNLLVVLQ